MDDFLDGYFDRVTQVIEQYGVMIQYVGAGHGKPPFAYTVGLAKVDHPELIISGLNPEVAHSVLNEMAIRVVKGNARWRAGMTDQVFGGGVHAQLVEVTDSASHLTIANRMFAVPGQGPLPALQVVYPDSTGRWPWDKDSTVVAAEPLLGTRQAFTDDIA